MWLSLTGGSKIFRGWGRQPQREYANLLFGIIFLENCMKMKRIGPGVGAPALGPLDPPLVIVMHTDGICFTTWHLFTKESKSSPKDQIAAPSAPPRCCWVPCFTTPLRLNQDELVGATNRQVLSAGRLHYPTSCNTIREKFPLK